MLRDDLKNLSKEEKIILVEELWDDIAKETEFSLTTEQKKLLARREKELLEGKVETKSWEEIKKNLNRKKKK